MTNDSGFLTSHQSLSNYSTLANTIKSLSISGKTITYTKGDNTTGTLTTQDNNTWTAMVGATSSSNGSVGYVNAVPPKDGYNTKYLRADGTWQVPPDHTYTVNNATLTIQKNGSTVKTFTANASSNVTCNITVPTKTSDLTNDSGFLTSHQDLSGYIPKAGGTVLNGRTYSRTVDNDFLAINGSSTDVNGAFLRLHGKDYSDTPYAGTIYIRAQDGTNASNLLLKPDGTAHWAGKNLAMKEDVIPRSGGAVISGDMLGRKDDTNALTITGGSDIKDGGQIVLVGASHAWVQDRGITRLQPTLSETNYKQMDLYPSGTWIWNGTACQITSDQRLKQQITEIDDKLLDAWEDVDLVQFKYNDAVEEKKDKARLHTGYVVQQIDEACQKHNIDISEYGLYCHEEYPEETEEVEVTQEDGTKTKETKVIREASEHYSLRYTETLVVECAYLRRENTRLKERLQQHDEYFSNVEKRLQSLENS